MSVDYYVTQAIPWAILLGIAGSLISATLLIMNSFSQSKALISKQRAVEELYKHALTLEKQNSILLNITQSLRHALIDEDVSMRSLQSAENAPPSAVVAGNEPAMAKNAAAVARIRHLLGSLEQAFLEVPADVKHLNDYGQLNTALQNSMKSAADIAHIIEDLSKKSQNIRVESSVKS